MSQRIGSNIIWNLAGLGLPTLLALIAIPLLIEKIGVARFGILSVGWAVLAYFAFFDFGLGKATTKYIAERENGYQRLRDEDIFSTSLALHTVLGVIASIILMSVSNWIASDVLNLDVSLQLESSRFLVAMALSLPLVLVTSCFRSTLEAFHRFDLINGLRIPSSCATYVVPVVVAYAHGDLADIGIAILATRCLFMISHFAALRVADTRLRMKWRIRSFWVKPLFAFGGWAVISGLTNPILMLNDRLIIGHFVNISMVSYYVTPYELVTKMWIISAGVLGVVFPVVAAEGLKQRGKIRRLGRRVYLLMLALSAPLVAVVLSFGSGFLGLWLGGSFAAISSDVLATLAIGVFFNILAQVPLTFLQALGMPRLVGVLQLAEMVVYLAIAWVVVQYYGIEGIAWLWTIRALFDLVALAYLARGVLIENIRISSTIRFFGALFLLAIYFVAAASLERLFSNMLVLKGELFVVVTLVYLFSLIFSLLDRRDRLLLSVRLRPMLGRR